MSYTLREADLLAERLAVLATLSRELEDWRDTTRFDWMYLEAPFGAARSWVLDDGQLSGVSSAFPRDVVARGERRRVWVLGDFCVGRSLRALGPALALQRVLNEFVDEKGVDAWYDVPSRSMMAVHRRLRVRSEGEMIRMVYPVKTDHLLEERLGEGWMAKGLAAVGNVALAARAIRLMRNEAVRVSMFEGRFDTSFPPPRALEAGVSVERTASYLNWRYRDDPRGAAQVLEGRHAEGRGGYLAFRESEEELSVLDAFGDVDDTLLRELLVEVILRARKAGVERVVASLSGTHPWLSDFERVGFRRRESAPFVVYSKDQFLVDPKNWFLMAGDRDL